MHSQKETHHFVGYPFNSLLLLPLFLGLLALGALSPASGQAIAGLNAEPVADTLFSKPDGAILQHVLDFNGDGKTDYAVVRNPSGVPGGQITWFVKNTSTAPTDYKISPWGIAGDFFVPLDYDGDSKTDIAVYRAAAPPNSYFYVLNSATSTISYYELGASGDDPSITADYTGDGKADPAVYRSGANSGNPSFWYYRASSGPYAGQVVYNQYGQNGDFPTPGDFNGDGKADFCIQRNGGGGQAVFLGKYGTGVPDSGPISFNIRWGTPTDIVVPGDYDGDGKTDICVVRGLAGQLVWFARPVESSTPILYQVGFGLSATDFVTPGDYDGDGKSDVAVWRPSATAGQTAFYVKGSTAGILAYQWGQNLDYPIANYNRH